VSATTRTQHNVPSPFGKVLATGYYDGPTEGFLVHKTRDELFFFHLLDWDDGQDVRVFEVAVVPGIALDNAVEVLSMSSPPKWPIWLLPAPLDESGEQFIEHARKIARPVAVAVTRNLLHTFDVWQEVDEEFVSSGQDWLKTFGLKRSTAS
jgi:hypothetical protein